MQYKIPQNVQIEDKIVGPLTLKQLIILGIGGGITYVIYMVLARQFFIEVWLIPTAISGLITLAFTFIRINGNSFGKWLLLIVEYMWNGKQRTYDMGSADHYEATIFAKDIKKEQIEDVQQTKAERDREKLANISEISATLDSFNSTTK